ncbi:MAG: PEGA domain-containing protein, partial [Myxococcota bacterium]
MVLSSGVSASDVRARPRVALLPFGAVSEGSPTVQRLEHTLRASVETLAGEDLVTAPATHDLLESASALGLRGHSADLSCLLKLAVLVELDQLLVPTLMLDTAGHHLHLALVDVTSGTSRGGLLPDVGAARDTLSVELERLAGALLVPERYAGTLVVETTEGGATVRLDGALIGQTPLAPLERVPAGDHVMVVSRRGKPAFTSTFAIEPGQATTIVVGDDHHDELLEGRSLGFLSGLSLAGVGGSVALLTGVGALSAEALLYSDAGEYHEREAAKNTGVVLLLTSAASAATAMVGGA